MCINFNIICLINLPKYNDICLSSIRDLSSRGLPPPARALTARRCLCMYVCTYIYIYIYIYTHTCVCMYIYIYICIYVCIHTCICVYIYIYTHAYIHTYIIHIYIYIYIHGSHGRARPFLGDDVLDLALERGGPVLLPSGVDKIAEANH